MGPRARKLKSERPRGFFARIPKSMITLSQTAILLTAAVVAVSLFRFLKLSSILGYVAAGLAIGPGD